MQSCCPAEEERLRRRGRQFDDPEQFRHADQASMPSSPAATVAIVTAPQEKVSGCSDNQLVSRKKDAEATQPQQEQLEERSSFSNADDSTGASIAEGGGFAPPLLDQDHHQGSAVDEEAGEREPRQHEAHSLEKPPGDQQTDEQEEEEEVFRPKGTMSARGVVRARRQWALRRARRREGPNKANQLELGGGSPAETGIREAWVETVVKVAEVSSRSGAVGGVSGNGGDGGIRGGREEEGAGGGRRGGNGVVESLVSSILFLEAIFFVKYSSTFFLSATSYTHKLLARTRTLRYIFLWHPNPPPCVRFLKYSSTIPSPCHRHVKRPRIRTNPVFCSRTSRFVCAEKETTGRSCEPPPRP